MAEPVQRLLKLDYADTVSAVRSISDAQNLLDLVCYVGYAVSLDTRAEFLLDDPK
jgi:hypothetical protein